MLKRMCLGAFLLMSVSVFAGFHYTATTTTESGRDKTVTKIEAWIDGDHAKILFLESEGNPMAEGGSYIITTDGGQTMFLVNPEEETYMEWDMDQMLQMATDMMESMGGLMSFEITDPNVEMLEQGPGEKLMGYATSHAKYRTTYDMKMKIMGMKQVHSYDTVQELWTTDKLKDDGFGVWLRNRPPAMKDNDLGRLIDAEMEKVKGFPLKTKTVTTSKRWNKKKTKVRDEQTSTSLMEVTSLKQESVSKDTFVIPDHYTKTEMAGSAEGEEGGNPFKGIFKRN